LLVGSALSACGGDWPAWRGPTGQGHCDEKNLPLTWSDTENVKWKVALEHQGNSTPIIFGDRIYLTQAHKDGVVRSLICLNRADGKSLWQRDVPYDQKERNWNPSWYCNASPVTDGKLIVVSFGSAGMYCYDTAGKEIWKRTDLGKWEHAFGNGSSPVLWGDLAILWCGPNEKEGRNFLLAVDKTTGKTVWEHEEKAGSWGTPLVTNVNGKDQLLLSTTPYLKGFDPQSGKELWLCNGLNKYVYTSPIVGNGMAVAMSGYTGAALAVRLGGTGDITADRLWLHEKNIQRVGSGLIVGEHAYIVEENGVPHCYELKSGEEQWKIEKRPNAGVTWGSMVHADGRLYVLMRNGATLVFAANPKYELLATNMLLPRESTYSSLAISNGEIYIRTFQHLWCISAKR
ncbi:MAG: PQQ-like beta-propeller repeat protein, partial [Planctomycetaceae bacterium]|nr:PQQ-like beta-propeller repeat protein [Planctomycetaceae bacterium]